MLSWLALPLHSAAARHLGASGAIPPWQAAQPDPISCDVQLELPAEAGKGQDRVVRIYQMPMAFLVALAVHLRQDEQR